MRKNPRGNEKLAAIVLSLVKRMDPPTMNELQHVSRVTNDTIGKMLEGVVPSERIIERLARAFPDQAVPLYEATGYPIPAELIPSVRKAMEHTGQPARQVVEDAVRRLLDGMDLSV
jgi:hypothetical protein